jgi:uncharacterized protein (TIGR03067 family)
MRPFTFSVLAALSLALSVRADDDAVAKELKRFQGDWRMVSATKAGKLIKGDALKDKVWRFDGNKIIPLDNKDDPATMTIDLTKKPATLDLKDKKGEVVLGIYKFNGDDKLIICGAHGNKHPTDFDSPKDSDNIVFEFERAKKK